MSNRIYASLGLISMLSALACSSSGSTNEAAEPSNTGSLASALSVDGGVDAGDVNVDAGDAGVAVDVVDVVAVDVVDVVAP